MQREIEKNDRVVSFATLTQTSTIDYTGRNYQGRRKRFDRINEYEYQLSIIENDRLDQRNANASIDRFSQETAVTLPLDRGKPD